MELIECLVKEYNNDKIKLHLYFNSIDYDKDFYYNPKNDILIAKSSVHQNETFGSDGVTMLQHMALKNIEILFKFK